jgi:hypothetical protein
MSLKVWLSQSLSVHSFSSQSISVMVATAMAGWPVYLYCSGNVQTLSDPAPQSPYDCNHFTKLEISTTSFELHTFSGERSRDNKERILHAGGSCENRFREELGFNAPTPLIHLSRYNPDAPYLQSFRHHPSRRFFTGGRRSLYRLDIELGRLEFLEHPLASREDILAGQLLGAFREYKKRERAGLAGFYAEKVRALQASVEAAKGRLRRGVGEAGASVRMPASLIGDGVKGGRPGGGFRGTENGAIESGTMKGDAKGSGKRESGTKVNGREGDGHGNKKKAEGMWGALEAEVEGLEAWVAEMQGELREARQLRDGEEGRMRELVGRMREVYRGIEEVRQQQGFRWALERSLLVSPVMKVLLEPLSSSES